MKVTFLNKQKDRKTITCNDGEKLLHAGLRQGIPLPYECGTGQCGTCIARAKPGTVQPNNSDLPGSKNLNLNKGEFLLCQCSVYEDCDILVDSKKLSHNHQYSLPKHQDGHLHNFNIIAPDVYVAELELPNLINFQAGQFFLFKAPGIEGYRAYSMTSYNQNTNQLNFVIKKVNQGKFTSILFDHDTKSLDLETFGPLGKATFDPEEKKDLLFITGGSGIAGIMSILDHADKINYFTSNTATIFFGARTFNDFFFIDKLTDIKKKYSNNVKLFFATSEENKKSLPQQISDHEVHRGYVHEVFSNKIGADCSEHIVFLGGPSVMVNSALPKILELGIPAKNIRFDRFG